MPGNALTAVQSSIGRLPTIGETASPPKPRKKLKQPLCNTGAGRHQSSGIAYVGRAGVLDTFQARSQCLWTTFPNPHSIIVHRSRSLFSSAQYDLCRSNKNFQRDDAKVCAWCDISWQSKPFVSWSVAFYLARPIVWCLRRFRLYDGTSTVLLE
jgi:hypothetical protein